ncbi:putative transcription factor [Senna tora]|uniref:Putative transcription factor n=1 Tax=Senna tora TaxID=362788 RepID=A0A834T028_9FABA|nr:putative transcription factor [Senna tora]
MILSYKLNEPNLLSYGKLATFNALMTLFVCMVVGAYGNLSQGGIIPVGATFGDFDLPGSMGVHQQAEHPHNMHQNQTHIHSSIHDSFPLTMVALQNCDQTISMPDFITKGDRSKNSGSDDDDEPSFTEEGVDGQNEFAARGKKVSPWQRVKWTNEMVKLMITTLSYVGEDVSSDSGRRKFVVLQIKGKWKSISKVMVERGYLVSPQQCEDKFNDLNKRYKRLNDMVGRGISCQVVENPALLDVIDYLSDKEKDDVRKILSSKHLFYKEMCSYHNGNRLHLPHDPALQRSLQAALKHRDDHDEDDQDVETDELDEFEETYCALGGPMKKLKHYCQGQDETKMFVNSLSKIQYEANQGLPESARAACSQKQWFESHRIQLEEQKLQIQAQMLELEKQRFKWQRFSKKKDQNLEKLRMENEKMKLENDRMALELKRKEMGSG